MLVLLSDIHLSDASTALNVSAGAFDVVANQVGSAAEGRNLTELRMVLLGDIFDLVRTSYWHEKAIAADDRPWGGTLDPLTGMNSKVTLVEGQFRDVLERVLATESAKGLIAAFDTLRQKFPSLGVTYVIGNHDRALNNFDSLKARIAQVVPGIKFDNVLHAEAAYGLLARHGHEWDDNCHGWKFRKQVLIPNENPGRFDAKVYNVMAIGEVVTAELMGGLIYNTAAELKKLPADPGDQAFLENLKDVNNLRPISAALAWIGWFTRGQASRYLTPVRLALRASLEALLSSSLAMKWDKLAPDLIVSGDLTDHLRKVRGLLDDPDGLRRLSGVADIIGNVKDFVHRAFGSDLDGLGKGAKEEFNGPLATGTEYIAYGHTHVPLYEYFSATHDGDVHMYINTGTYLPFVERARDGSSFASAGQMTLAYFLTKDEGPHGRAGRGPGMDVWNGIRRTRS